MDPHTSRLCLHQLQLSPGSYKTFFFFNFKNSIRVQFNNILPSDGDHTAQGEKECLKHIQYLCLLAHRQNVAQARSAWQFLCDLLFLFACSICIITSIISLFSSEFHSFYLPVETNVPTAVSSEKLLEACEKMASVPRGCGRQTIACGTHLT